MANFEACVAVTLREEGSEYTNDPDDRGGPTRYGITLADLVLWRSHDAHPDMRTGVTGYDVRALTLGEAKEIYRAKYWNIIQGDLLPDGIALCVFDYGVNSGPVRAVKLLQRLVGVPVDGGLGPITLKATLNYPDHEMLIGRYQDARESFLETLANFWKFGNGWVSRVHRVEFDAISMMNAAEVTKRVKPMDITPPQSNVPHWLVDSLQRWLR